MRLLPHMNQALNSMEGKPPDDNNAQGASGKKSPINPLAQKMGFGNNKGPVQPPPDNSKRTGISITNGTYLNANGVQK